VTSSPESNAVSKSLAFIYLHLFLSRTPHRDDPDTLTTIRDDARPVLAGNQADHEEPWLVFGSSRYLNQSSIVPQRLRLDEADSVLAPVLKRSSLGRSQILWYKSYTCEVVSTRYHLFSMRTHGCAFFGIRCQVSLNRWTRTVDENGKRVKESVDWLLVRRSRRPFSCSEGWAAPCLAPSVRRKEGI